jgi:transcriptional regulator with XRE-family HTH domain
MNRKQFGQLVAALRKEHYDELGAVWTQAKLGEEARLSESLVGNIERGAKANLEPDLLLGLAQALRLTTGERYEFFAAASGVDPSEVSQKSTAPTTGLHALLEIMADAQLPATVFDVYSDIVAINHAAAVLGGAQQLFANAHNIANPLMFNSTYHYFAPEFEVQRRKMGSEQEEFANRYIMNFRINSLRYRAEPYFRYLLTNLMRSNTFQRHWRQVHLLDTDHFMDTVPLSLDDPALGRLYFTTSAVVSMTKYGPLRLLLYAPMDRATTAVFQKLMQNGGGKIYPLPSWPHKKVPDGFV